MQKVKQWEFEGFNRMNTEKLDNLLMSDKISYWFHFRTIPWYQIRRISIETPSILKKLVLEELNIHIDVEITKKTGNAFSKWIIKPINLK